MFTGIMYRDSCVSQKKRNMLFGCVNPETSFDIVN